RLAGRPLRMQRGDHQAVGCPGVAAVDEAGLGALRALGAEADRAVRTVLGPAEDRLEGDGHHREKQLADMGAAAGAADRLVDRLAPATRDAGADEGLEVGPGLDAGGIRR